MSRRSMVLGIAAARAARPSRSEVDGHPLVSGLAPLRLPDTPTELAVCLRPFRAAGPRLEAERFGGKRLVHNYGHGGAGWSLSWGCAEEAAALALAEGAKDIAVIGAGAIGLTTAVRLAKAGAQVTVYAEALPKETGSAKATGVWSPDSRVALAGAAEAGFPARWEGWARAALAAHEAAAARPDPAAEFAPRFILADAQASGAPRGRRRFLDPSERIADLLSAWEPLPPGCHPFPVESALVGMGLTFDIRAYTDQLAASLRARGAVIERRRFRDASELMALAEPVIVNCTGYGARALFGDDRLVPVRGQTARLPPQAGALYGAYYRDVGIVSRRDGVVIQAHGPNEDHGWNDASEAPDTEEAAASLRTARALFAGWRAEPAAPA